ncbi:MAG: hypothetical protein ACXWE3_11965 [Methylobacter sp.]
MSYTLIDSPVTPYSTLEAIQAWIDELTAMPESDQRDMALMDAQKLLADALADKDLLAS